MSAVTVSSATTPITQPASGGWVRRHRLLAMYILMFVLAWAVLVPQALASRGLLPFAVPVAVSLLAGWSPAIAALVITGRVDGGAGVRRLLGRFLVVRVGLPWYLAALGLYRRGGVASRCPGPRRGAPAAALLVAVLEARFHPRAAGAEPFPDLTERAP